MSRNDTRIEPLASHDAHSTRLKEQADLCSVLRDFCAESDEIRAAVERAYEAANRNFILFAHAYADFTEDELQEA